MCSICGVNGCFLCKTYKEKSGKGLELKKMDENNAKFENI